MSDPLLRLDGLDVRFGATTAVADLTLAIARGETAAIVGETGSGKSVSMLATLGLLPASARIGGTITFEDEALVPGPRLDRVRGREIAMIFQEPQSALDPLFTVGSQIAAILHHRAGLGRTAAKARTLALLEDVGIAEARRRARAYPHELSGGQRQRVAIAMAMACEPKLIIADEPTTAIDATVAARVLALLADLKARHGLTLVLVSHDLGLVRRVADTIHVMEGGRLVESGPAARVMEAPAHAYTRRLVAAENLPSAPPSALDGRLLLEATDVRVVYPLRARLFARRKTFPAVEGVSLRVAEGETLGVIGESGSGKSTLGRALIGLQAATGSVRFDGVEVTTARPAAMRAMRRHVQIVLQDPFSSLSPRFTVEAIVGEGLAVQMPEMSRPERHRRVIAMLAEVGLSSDLAQRLPAELSGGQRQRVAIARAMVLAPRLVVLDEPTSALDRSVQADVLALLRRLQHAHRVAYVFITHDLAVVRAMATRTIVMKNGRLVEMGATQTILEAPREAYTKALVAAAFGTATEA